MDLNAEQVFEVATHVNSMVNAGSCLDARIITTITTKIKSMVKSAGCNADDLKTMESLEDLAILVSINKILIFLFQAFYSI
jgi:hypothetical protein